MAHFAKVKDGIVTNVIVAEQEFIDNLLEEEAGTWIKTSYNTYKGEHKLGGTPLRKNYAGKGFTYDSTFFDIIKAVIPVIYVKINFPELIYIASLCAFLGHVFAIWLKFKHKTCIQKSF